MNSPKRGRVGVTARCVLLSLIISVQPEPAQSFQYKLPSQEITAPEMLCFSGDALSLSSHKFSSSIQTQSLPCPTTAEEVENYPAVVMDEAGYVNINMENVILRDDGRRRHETIDGYYHRQTREKKVKEEKQDEEDEEEEEEGEEEDDVKSSSPRHHLQIYLIPLDEYKEKISTSQCCYELEVHGTPRKDLPTECQLTGSADSGGTISHDYRVHAPRVGQMATVSAPMRINALDQSVDIIGTLRPTKRGRYMVVVSNCAAEVSHDPFTNTTRARGIKAVMQKGLQITFVSKFGELPLSMMGIIPFYGALFFCYGILFALWRYKAITVQPVHSMIGLQRAIRLLVMAQFVFCGVAFFYYLHLNNSSVVDAEVLYSGTAAALVNWGPWSILVAICHFGTIFGCQVVVTLATDGTWLIQNTIRGSTKKGLAVLCGVWIAYFALYGFLGMMWRKRLFALGGVAWIVFLMFNVRRSLRHLKSLMVGQSNDMILAIGGAIVAKRSLYRKMCLVVGGYPLVFLISLAWTSQSREDSWAWVGYVLGDMYLFVILLHASYIWMPRPMASQEAIKYAPLEMEVTDDADFWEGNVDKEQWEDESVDFELSDKRLD